MADAVARREVVGIEAPGARPSYTIRFRRTERPPLSSTVQNSQNVTYMELFGMRQQHSAGVRAVVFTAALAVLPMSAFAQPGHPPDTTKAVHDAAVQTTR